ncbi:phosphogluconate dehydrogenase (NADP(+)-dependent, decarboxylating) [Roseovarius sp. A46]|uniref:NADP-dependent phosphogluconate dehydrogenase n=1 Tax=Roseovarius sp. A46 TaxID=2109331 RepID=UPI00101281D3|nr:NADP-dependent phosphogluconate dehydrogenase [Roseovarius sp. A46]RXV66257.1 phosphogluconate dehydrogenase (NADP(+)-dependent, decarboxylating) [Roseovarius sp. A46]
MASARIGIYGLGTMGSALALNMAEKGFDVAVSNREAEWIAPFIEEAGGLADRLYPHEKLADFVAALERPRIILFMIPSGAPMDAMLREIDPLLAPGDIVIDGGNADFHDTRRRARELSVSRRYYVGLGVSGGEAGARTGPSMMVGGPLEAWQRIAPILTAIAARHDGSPCVAHLGPDGAGHFVKTVHNGIEYADMQIIAEIYGLLRGGAGLSPPEIGTLFETWNAGPLRSFLVEITAEVLAARDPQTGHPVVDVIKDAAGQKGTGRWTVIEALRLGQSASVIEAAVGARSWSSEKEVRQAAEAVLGGAAGAIVATPETLAEAFLAARLLAYAQGFRVIAAASEEYGWALEPEVIARIWRAGCIIRADLLDDIAGAFAAGAPEGELLLAPGFAERLVRHLPALRQVVAEAVHAGHPVPALSAALAWYDTMRHGHGTAGLIQAQRDRFGHHGFERLGQPGRHHGPWWD